MDEIPLPADYDDLIELKRDERECVYAARWRESRVLVRHSTVPEGSQTRAELELLAAVSHPGLAGLRDHGQLADGSSWLAREWIDGEPLTEAAGRMNAEELGRVVARLCPALDFLHRRGFVHADVKADNVIVTVSGDPILTDFGLARRSGDADQAGSVSGSWFSIAPEVLLGGTADARSDLFALGVLLHQLLIGRRPAAREFYARFPHEPFLEASETSVDELPEWARDVVAQLLETDPSARPASALAVGLTLAGRLDVELVGAARSPRELELTVSPLTGREEWVESWVDGTRSGFQRFQLSGDREPVRPQWLVLPEGESGESFLDQLRLRAAVARVPVRRVDLALELRDVVNTGQLDRWARDLVGRSRDTCLFAHARSGDHWSARALECLARTTLQAQDVHRDSVVLLVSASQATGPDDDTLLDETCWRPVQVPALSAQDIADFLASRVEVESDEQLTEFAERLHSASGGATARLDRLISSCVESGWIVDGDPKPRLRPTAHKALVAEPDETVSALEPAAALLCATLRVRGGESSLESLRSANGRDGAGFVTALHELRNKGLVSIVPSGSSRALALTAKGRGVKPSLTGDDWRGLLRRETENAVRERASNLQVLPLSYAAGDDRRRDIIDEARFHRERGCPEIAIDFLDELRALAELSGRACEPAIVGEVALAWIALGSNAHADGAIAELTGRDDDASRATIASVRGHLARRNQEFEKALEELQLARRLGHDDLGDLLLSEARLYYETRRTDELDRLLSAIDAGEHGHIHPRIQTNFQNIRAMSAFRSGDSERALISLSRHLVDAQTHDDPFHEAGVRINLGTIHRRTGGWEKAVEQFEHAERLYEDEGYLPGLAQARALLGGTLRESGRLADAEPLFASSLEMRERLGDRTGGQAVRGMLGLLHAEKGTLRAAVEELSRSADELARSARKDDARVLSSRLDEVRARLGAVNRNGAPARTENEDPRCAIAWARRAWLQGDADLALELASEARERAGALNLKHPEEEASFLIERIARTRSTTPPPTRHADYQSPLVDQDAELCRLLEAPDLDGDRARLFAQSLARRGRSDRAVRLYWAIRARSSDPDQARTAGREGDAIFAEISRGLTEREKAAFENSLLAMPDPWPDEIARRRESGTADSSHEIELFLSVSRSIVEQEDLTTLLGTIVECALEVTGGTRGFIVLEENGELHFDTALDSRRGDIKAPEVEISESVIRKSLSEMRPLRLSNASDDPFLGSSPSITDLELRSILSCPFDVEDGLRGVIYVDNQLHAGAFDDRAERLIAHLGHQAAIAIRQVRRMEEISELNARLKSEVADTQSDLHTARAALREAGLPLPPSGLIGSSPAIRQVHELIARAASTQLPVLVCGPSGTGKELTARALHQLSKRASGPFVSENCASLPGSLIESEFFGYKKGAFTGADENREGMFERAQGGTIFLDEIGEVSLELQAKLLRVLETGEVRRLGDSEVRTVDFRLVAATNRDLEAGVDTGTFRADLYYRLDALRIDMPPLSDRIGDIPALVHHFLRQEEARTGVRRDISKNVMAALCRREWPGNVRELSNEVARLCVLSDDALVDPDAIRTPAKLRGAPREETLMTLAQLERRAIEEALRRSNGDKAKAAKLLGTSRAKVYQRLKQWRDDEQLR